MILQEWKYGTASVYQIKINFTKNVKGGTKVQKAFEQNHVDNRIRSIDKIEKKENCHEKV